MRKWYRAPVVARAVGPGVTGTKHGKFGEGRNEGEDLQWGFSGRSRGDGHGVGY